MLDVTVVITSCRRFGLLNRTLESFFSTNDYLVSEIIIVEDSDDKNVLEILEMFPNQGIRVLLNGSNFGQLRSIDIAYSQVKIPYILHMEDDWLFCGSGLIHSAVNILKMNPEILLVQMRTESDMPSCIRCLPDTVSPVPYKKIPATAHHVWYSFTFNPSLKRISDYLQLSGGYSAFFDEVSISLYYKDMGKVMAWIKNADVRHIGYGCSNYQYKYNSMYEAFRESLKRFFSMKTLYKWQESLRRRINHFRRVYKI
ncbi:hypothetical protein B488_08510 [Liberibacter crescens BT-1]|uniref:Glycosyltransferase 2-like domain-containing protein n=1 Tax=Liberibacter crescens (strain BT-1) TaxID=1215343 RepID=L0EVZ4_LIBCB|nr:glycosyltransferase [Liberibacter crescens]AGA64843.1 hypothetical protein B488_08510 [Liberibacter crescens BT-1]